MRWYANFKIGMKLATGFGLIILLIAILGSYSIYSSNKMDSDYSYVLSFPQHRYEYMMTATNDYTTARRSLSHMALFAGVEDGAVEIDKLSTTLQNAINELNDNLNKYIDNVNADTRLNDTEKSDRITAANSLIDLSSQYLSLVATPVAQANKNDDRAQVMEIAGTYAYISNDLFNGIEELTDKALDLLDNLNKQASIDARQSITILIGFVLAIILVCVVLAVIITSFISKPVKRLVTLVENVAEGNLNVNIDKNNITHDEIGDLTHATSKLIDTILTLVQEMDHMSNDFQQGDIESRVNSDLFTGSYQTVALGVNDTIGNLTGEVITFLGVMQELSNGNFKADMRRLPGKKAIMNEMLSNMRNNLQGVTDEIGSLVKDASVGKLSSRAATDRYKGDWAALLSSLNELMEIIVAPIHESADVLKYVEEGNFDHKVEGAYKGDFLTIKNAINNTVTNVSSYIEEISTTLSAIADNDLNVSITRTYIGRFSAIKDSLNNIVATLNRVISDILNASEQVAAGAKQISESSMTLAQGASEQASAVEELNATVITINEGTHENAMNAKNAQNLSDSSRENASRGSDNMQDMQNAMEGIRESSSSISRIIRVISDIAFQTNLLALNAAVEAARAGEHGKGFVVVAEEVRNLASRSQEAANETSTLIEESIRRVNEGVQMADNTAKAFKGIVTDVTKVAEIIGNIANASDDQADAVSQVTEGVSQIATVIQNNSATSEESASASEQLASQADVLKSLVSVFRLKNM